MLECQLGWQKGVSLMWFYENCKMINSYDSLSVPANKSGFVAKVTVF